MAQRYFLASFAGLLTAIGVAQGLALLPHANADDVYALAFVSDVISGQDPIYWTVGSHNSFIPDKIIVALGYLLGFDGGANLVFFAAVYYFLLFVAIVFFVRSMNFDSANAALIGAFVIIFCGFYDPKHAALAQLFVTACIHNGVLPFALFIFGLVVRFVYVDDRQGLAWLALWLTTLIVFSDAIAIVQIVVPALAVLLIVVVMQRPQRKPAAAMALALIIGTAAGVALQSFLSEFKSIQQVPLTFQTSRMLEAAANYVRLKDEIAGALGWPRLLASFGGLVVGSILSVRWILRRELDNVRFGVALATFGGFAALMGPFLTGVFDDAALVRQQIPFYVLPIVVLAVLAMLRLKPSPTFVAAVATGLGLFGLALFFVWSFTGPSGALVRSHGVRFLPQYRAMVDALEPLRADMVMATYWDAKPLYLASDRTLSVCQVGGALTPYAWSTNLGWCESGFQRWTTRRSRLAISMRELEPEVLQRTYGFPEQEVEVAGRKFALYSWSMELEQRVRAVLCDMSEFPSLSFCKKN